MITLETINQVKQASLNERIQFIEIILKSLKNDIMFKNKSSKRNGSKINYDFSDLIGKLTWTGDPVSEQRALRDEW